MTREEIIPHIGKKAVVTADNKQKFMGIITNTESEFDTESGKEEIELYTGHFYVGIPFDEIVSILDIE